MIKEFNGLISEGHDWDEILIADCPITNTTIQDLFDEDEKAEGLLKVGYFISNSPIDPLKAKVLRLLTYYEGISELDAGYMGGSEWTGTYARNDTFDVGGHDITKELRTHKGKYCLLIIELLGK